MLLEKNDSQTYVAEFKKRFSNFAEKAPVLLSYTTTPKGVQIVDEATDTVYDFTWEFSIPVKTFIHGIKMKLVPLCYPRMLKQEEIVFPLSEEEQIELAATAENLENIPTTRTILKSTPFRLDKVITYKDIFIIENLETKELFRYKMNSSCVFFLKKMRSGRLNEVDAAKYFFDKSTLLNKIEELETRNVE